MSYDYAGMIRDFYEEHVRPRGAVAAFLFVLFLWTIVIPAYALYGIAKIFWPVFVAAACTVAIWRMR